MDDNQPISPDNLMQDLLTDTESLRQRLLIAEEKVMHLELALLHSRDFAIGAAAELGEQRVQVEYIRNLYIESERNLGDATTHIASHLNHIQRLENAQSELLRLTAPNVARSKELDRVYESATWRIGRLIMLPIRILKRLAS
ncbi:MAG: hypothetical protein HQ486_01250 [Acidimicrobiaceae bacterium]|nr:hypothetical protein [Acidimicrobiaceae bacterium]